MTQSIHYFHIPVMGTSFSIDTPIKVARYGISSVMSIGDDELCEVLREKYSEEYGFGYLPIKKWEEDYRARRITGYLNMVKRIVDQQIDEIRASDFVKGSEITKYFTLLASHHPLKLAYTRMLEAEGSAQVTLQEELRASVRAGSLDVNIMTKLDRNNETEDRELLPEKYSDALAALRGFAKSKLESGIVFSAGFNRRLYAYLSNFEDFFPDAAGRLKKTIILKVSDFRSSVIQGKFLAKKGVWISEYRIESGLNCGGHAFPTEGNLLGPILAEFKEKKEAFTAQMMGVANAALDKLNKIKFEKVPALWITVQGGIGTSIEQQSLFDEFDVDGTGWATPFLLVKQATTVDAPTRQQLADAKEEDLVLSDFSPLGIPFNSIKGTASEKLKAERIKSGRPGSPCPKGHLVSNTEFTKRPVCTASVSYQRNKIRQLKSADLSETAFDAAYSKVVAKSCLCEDLAAGSLIAKDIKSDRPLASAVCPGPNLAYFSKLYTLSDMIGHIYGRLNLINPEVNRSNMFVNELRMYIDYLRKEIVKSLPEITDNQKKYLSRFQGNLFEGIEFYKTFFPRLKNESEKCRYAMATELAVLREELEQLVASNQLVFSEKTLSV